MRYVQGLLLVASAFYAIDAQSVTYYWKGGNSWADYGTLSNWSTESATGADATELPGAYDKVESQTCYFDLGGLEYTLGSKDEGSGSGSGKLQVRNGILHIKKSSSVQNAGGEVLDGGELVIESDAIFTIGYWNGATCGFDVKQGGVFQIDGRLDLWNGNVSVSSGGVFILNGVARYSGDGYARSAKIKNNGGDVVFSKGFINASSVGLSTPLAFYQTNGTLTLGGDVDAGKYNTLFEVSGGTIHVVSNCAVKATAATLSGQDLQLEVDKDVFFDISRVSIAHDTSIVKTGDGMLAMESFPDTLTLQRGVVRTSSEVPSVVFAGGVIELVAETKSISCITAVSVSEGTKAKISLRDLYLLPPGDYTVVSAGNTLAESDYEFDIDASVSASVSVKDDGSVVLTVYGINEDPNALTWNPENDFAIWDAATAAWTLGGQQVAFADWCAVVFNGQESNYSGTVVVDGVPRASYLSVQSDRDYRFSGDEIDTMYVIKSGNGALMIDSGFTGRSVDISGGSLSFGSQKYVKDGIDIAVAASGSARLDAHNIAVKKLFDFRYLAGSSNWETRRDYDISLSVESIADFIEKASPTAPDGTSLSGKSVYISGAFFVNSDEAGTWSFTGIYDDGIILNIDGEQLFKTTGHQDTKTANVVLAEGWHTFEIRAYDGVGGWGHANCLLAQNPTLESYVPFHEGNFDMNWYGSEIDSNLPPADIPVNLAIADGASVVFGSAGYNITDISIGENVSISIDPHTVPANNTFLVVKDAEVKAALKDMIQEALGDIGTVVDTEDGLAWEMEAVFNNPDVTDLEDVNGWAIGIVPGCTDDVTITGDGVAPVMTSETRMFNSITVSGGASLAVAGNREIPALTLNSGTSLHVAKQGVFVHEVSYPEFITKTETAIGMMDADKSIKEITDISGLIGGQDWNASLKGKPYNRVDVEYVTEENSEKLRVQFKNFESPYMKCVIIELRKDDQGVIYAKATDCGYIQDLNDYDYDFYANSDSYVHKDVATADNTKAYGVRGVTFTAPFSAAANVTVVAAGAFAAIGDGTVEVNVDEGCMLDLSEVNVETGAKLVKTGLGTIFFGNKVPSSVEIAEGVVELLPYVEYDMSGVVVGENAAIKVRINGKYEDVAPLVRDDKILYMAKYTYCGVGSWNEVSNWAGGVLPGADDIVYVHGEGTEFYIDDAQVVMPLKIVAEDGIMIRITESISLSSQIQLAPLSKVLVGDGSKDVSVDIIAGFSASADTESLPVAIPTVEVAAHATMLVSTEEKFKNIFLKVFGTIKPRDGKKMTFGWAESGETTYFGLFVDGGTLDVTEGKSFASPAAGGTVIVQEPIVVKNAKIPTGWYSVINIGKNNNPDYPFDFVLDNSTLFTGVYDSYIGGAATLFVTNNAWLRNDINNSRSIQIRIVEKGRIVLQNDGNLRFVPSNGFLRIENDEGAPAGLVLAGGRLEPWHQSGSKNSSIHVSQDSYWDLYSARINPFGDDRAWNNEPLADLREVYIEEDSTLIFRFIKKLGNWGAGAQSFLLGNTPISGAGSVVLENSREDNDLFTVTIRNGENTSTGTAAADDRSMLLFADGANWAGTVIAGNVALTNLTDGAAAASVNFAKLDLAADFPVRVWRDENGALVSDTLNVGEYLDSGAKGGRLAIAAMFEGEFSPGETFVLGTISKNAELPRVGRGWTAKIVEIEGDEENAQLLLERNSGFSIVIR